MKRRSPALQNRRASGARSAAGRLERKTSGSAPAGTSGTRSIREVYAQPASTSGLRPSASRAVDGRRVLPQLEMEKAFVR
jgi:hypothetical protein